MLSAERRNIILERLKSEKKVQVGEMSAEFEVSEETIRRDLERLEREGYASRVYGGAVLCEDVRTEPTYAVRKQTNVDAKKKIAAQVAQLVDDGDFIMLDESSTSMFIARALKDKKNLTVITNSIEVILAVTGIKGWSILSTGGALKPDLLAQTGYQAEAFLQKYHVDKAIISCTGLDFTRGCTCTEEDASHIKRAMMNSANKTILAVDSAKFGKKAFISLCKLTELTAIVTDTQPDSEWREKLAEQDIDLYY